MKYRGFANNVKKYIIKYFCKYKSKNRFKRMEYFAFKQRIYNEWYFSETTSFEEYTCKREYFNDWVDRSRLNLILMGYVQNSKSATGEKLYGFKPGHGIVIYALHNNNQSAIKQLPILFKGGQ